jgi:hypothetical protein
LLALGMRSHTHVAAENLVAVRGFRHTCRN